MGLYGQPNKGFELTPKVVLIGLGIAAALSYAIKRNGPSHADALPETPQRVAEKSATDDAQVERNGQGAAPARAEPPARAAVAPDGPPAADQSAPTVMAPSAAEPTPAPPGETLRPDEIARMCKNLSGMASTIMANRQNGVQMSAQMDVCFSQQSMPQFFRLCQALVTDAYVKPRYQTAEYILAAVRDFEDEAYLTCTKAFGSPGD